MKNLALKITFAILLAFVVNSFVYFGFVNSYSSKILNFQNFSGQFESGIYQYRILSGYFLIWLYDFLGSLNLDYSSFKLKFLNPNAEPRMYLSFYLLNTFFTICSAILMVLIAESKYFAATNSEKILLVSVGIFTIALSQFVIVPYDCSAYFFILLFVLIFLKYLEKPQVLTLALLVVIMIISTFNRESSALSLSFAATLLYAKYGKKKETLIPIFVLGLSFVAVYLGIRFFSEKFTTNDGSLLAENFSSAKNLLGILFWIVFLAFALLISKDKKTQTNILVFYLFAVPYLLMCLYSGILYEIRLYVPIFLSSLLLSRLELPKRSLN